MSRCCHRCGAGSGAVGRVGRRDTCSQCGADLHCCLNCRFYDPGCHNQCREPQAERQVDKERGNFCEYFAFLEGARARAGGAAGEQARARLESLFAKKKKP